LLKKALNICKLEEFVTTFNFEIPVPVDMIPILTNTQQKQEYIIQRNAKMAKGNDGEAGPKLEGHQSILHKKQSEKEETKKEK
jgi:hypothetical protein